MIGKNKLMSIAAIDDSSTGKPGWAVYEFNMDVRTMTMLKMTRDEVAAEALVLADQKNRIKIDISRTDDTLLKAMLGRGFTKQEILRIQREQYDKISSHLFDISTGKAPCKHEEILAEIEKMKNESNSPGVATPPQEHPEG